MLFYFLRISVLPSCANGNTVRQFAGRRKRDVRREREAVAGRDRSAAAGRGCRVLVRLQPLLAEARISPWAEGCNGGPVERFEAQCEQGDNA
jgi:hypothetical protein